MNRILKTALLMTIFVAAGGLAVQAQGMGKGLVGTHCKKEIAKYCPDVPHGAGEVPKCLNQYKDKLSEQCKEALASKGPGGGMGQGKGSGGR